MKTSISLEEMDAYALEAYGRACARTLARAHAKSSGRAPEIAGYFGQSTVLVDALGRFPLPVEVIPMAAAQIARRFKALGGEATLRLKDGQPLVTDNGQHILDVRGLTVNDPLAFESEVNQWPGVVTVGVFAHQKASVCLLGTAQGVRTLEY